MVCAALHPDPAVAMREAENWPYPIHGYKSYDEMIEAEAKKHGLEYRHIPVTTSTITYKDVAAFNHALLRGAKPVLVHCRSGARSYVLWALTRVFFDGESPLMLAADAAKKGYDLRVLPALVEKLQAEKDKG